MSFCRNNPFGPICLPVHRESKSDKDENNHSLASYEGIVKFRHTLLINDYVRKPIALVRLFLIRKRDVSIFFASTSRIYV